MPKHAVSVTLDTDNLLWLKSRTLAAKRRSLSETLDGLVTEARLSGRVPAAAVRSVVGTADIAVDDPGLDRADEYLHGLFTTSLSRPVVARETAPPFGRRRGRAPRRG